MSGSGRGQADVGLSCQFEQEAHHAKVTFQDELRRLLSENGMEWDEAYLWD